MKVERVKVLTTLKAGDKVWGKGEILSSPIPADIISEIRAGTGTVEVLEGEGFTGPKKSKLIKRAE